MTHDRLSIVKLFALEVVTLRVEADEVGLRESRILVHAHRDCPDTSLLFSIF